MIHRSRRSGRGRRALVLALLAIGLLATPRGPAEAKRWESDQYNVVLEIPDDPFPWDWVPQSSSFDKYHIKKAARRVLEKYRSSGKEAEGEGARLDLVVRDATETETLESVAADKNVHKFFLGRYQKHEPMKSEETDLIGDVKAIQLTVDGVAKNLKGKSAACFGLMIVAVLRKKVYLLRMYAWHTEYDEEGLKQDLEFIAADGLSFQITDSLEAPKRPPVDGEGPSPEDDSDEPDEDEIIWYRDGLLRMVRDGRLKRKAMTARERKQWLILKLEGNSQAGSHQLFMYAIPHSRLVNGVQAGQENIKRGITTTWYGQFLASHPAGTIFKFKWPKKGAYLALPELKDENRVVLFDGKKKKRVLKPSATEIIKKLGIVEKVKKSRIGDWKSSEAFRGNMQGLQDGVGKVTTLRWSWTGKNHSYRILVTLARDGYMKYGEAMGKTIESIHIYKKAPKFMEQEISDQAAKNAKLKAEREAREDKKDEADKEEKADEKEPDGK